MLTPTQTMTIERIQASMQTLEYEAEVKGLDPSDYVQTKELKDPTNQDEYILSLAELGVESDLASDDSLSWSVEIEDIEETLATYPTVEKTSTLDRMSQVERDLVKKWLSTTPSDARTTKKKDNGKSIDF